MTWWRVVARGASLALFTGCAGHSSGGPSASGASHDNLHAIVASEVPQAPFDDRVLWGNYPGLFEVISKDFAEKNCTGLSAAVEDGVRKATSQGVRDHSALLSFVAQVRARLGCN